MILLERGGLRSIIKIRSMSLVLSLISKSQAFDNVYDRLHYLFKEYGDDKQLIQLKTIFAQETC